MLKSFTGKLIRALTHVANACMRAGLALMRFIKRISQ